MSSDIIVYCRPANIVKWKIGRIFLSKQKIVKNSKQHERSHGISIRRFSYDIMTIFMLDINNKHISAPIMCRPHLI